METKICAQCGQEKPIEDFSKSYKNYCKACVADNERAKRHAAKIALPETADIMPRYIPDARLCVATAAMQGITARGDMHDPEDIAREAVLIADALLSELKKEKK